MENTIGDSSNVTRKMWQSKDFVIRNLLEYVAIVVIWLAFLWLHNSTVLSATNASLLALGLCWAKTVFFGAENLRQLLMASVRNMPYHRFMLLMLVNMSQIILSFGLDFHCLHQVDAGSFSVEPGAFSGWELVFEYVYFSTLNFTFFGYGDDTPQTVVAKLMTMTEILLAFITVIFLLSDFISLKESISRK
jgi:Ion channel